MCALCSPPCARGRAGRHTSRTNAPQYAAAAAAVVAASLHDVRPRLREAVGPADGRGRARWGSCLGGPSLTSQRVTSGPASWVGSSSGSKLEVARLQPNLASRVSTAQQRAAAPRPSSKQDEARRVDARRPAAPNGHGVGCVFHARPETAKPKSIRCANRWRHAGRASDRLSGCESRAILTPVHGISKSSECDVAGRVDQTHAQPCLLSISTHASANLQLRDEVFFFLSSPRAPIQVPSFVPNHGVVVGRKDFSCPVPRSSEAQGEREGFARGYAYVVAGVGGGQDPVGAGNSMRPALQVWRRPPPSSPPKGLGFGMGNRTCSSGSESRAGRGGRGGDGGVRPEGRLGIARLVRSASPRALHIYVLFDWGSSCVHMNSRNPRGWTKALG